MRNLQAHQTHSNYFHAWSVFFILLISPLYSLAQSAKTPSITDVLSVATEFCLVNATDSAVSVSGVSGVDNSDWAGQFLPQELLGKTILPYASSCWPLAYKKGLKSRYQFDIEINTTAGNLKWNVKQHDAVGKIHRNYETIINGTTYTLMQKGGDNNGYATNVFILENDSNTQKDYLSNWMKNIPDGSTLNNIQLIGTHDAGVNAEDGVSCQVPADLAIAQATGLATQLTDGVRYFDIRLETQNDKLHYPYHKFMSIGCSSKKSFEQSMNDMIQFVKEHPTETVLLKISHTAPPVDSVIKMFDSFTSSTETGRYFYKSPTDTYSLADKTMGELRGKIVLLLDCEYTPFLDPQKGYFSFSTTKTAKCNPDDDAKLIYDHYSNTKDFDTMYKGQINLLKQHGTDKNKLFLLSWTITGGEIIAHTPRPAASLVGLSKEQFGKTLPSPGIIYYDFENPGINIMLIKNNEINKALLPRT